MSKRSAPVSWSARTVVKLDPLADLVVIGAVAHLHARPCFAFRSRDGHEQALRRIRLLPMVTECPVRRAETSRFGTRHFPLAREIRDGAVLPWPSTS